jgi:hypothetical protein
MNSCQKRFSACLLTTALLVGASSARAQDFAVLAGTAVTCTDGNITGDVGTARSAAPGAITLTNCPTGTVHKGDTVAQQAYAAFLAAYKDLTPKSTDVCTRTFVEEAFTGVAFELPPGVYCFPAAVTFTGTTLTLNGDSNDKWLFKVGTQAAGALTGTSFSVVMAGGAQSCNVTWWVDAGATMTTSNLKGNLLTGADITFTGGSFIKGDALAGGDGSAFAPTGAVTLTGGAVVGCEGGSPGPGPLPGPSACSDRITGGGYITVMGKKANFGVTAGFKKGALRGHLTYIDHGKPGLKLKSTRVTAYEEIDATTRFIAGTANINGVAGTYTVVLSDDGEPGKKTDSFAIRLFDAAGKLTYSASGKIAGGNIQLHKRHCDRNGHAHDDDDDDGDDDHGHDDDDDDDHGDHGKEHGDKRK